MGSEVDPGLHKLCIRESLKEYLEVSRKFRIPNCLQLFVAYGTNKLGHPVSITTISRWLSDTIAIAYLLHHLLILHGIKAHQTWKVSVSIAEMAGVSAEAICKASMWLSQCMFAHFYHLSMAATAGADFSRRVLQVTSSSTASKVIKKKYCSKTPFKIPKLKKP